MRIRASSDPYSGYGVLVDKRLGAAYQTVQTVVDNMDAVKAVADNLTNILGMSDSVSVVTDLLTDANTLNTQTIATAAAAAGSAVAAAASVTAAAAQASASAGSAAASLAQAVLADAAKVEANAAVAAAEGLLASTLAAEQQTQDFRDAALVAQATLASTIAQLDASLIRADGLSNSFLATTAALTALVDSTGPLPNTDTHAYLASARDFGSVVLVAATFSIESAALNRLDFSRGGNGSIRNLGALS